MKPSLSYDELMMQHALELSMKARVIAPPNPWVGCVITNDNEIVGEGYTQPPGQAHAEVVALKQAKEKARRSTVYVTLEPCSHFGRTPPCSNALIEAQVSRVVIGLEDPDCKVHGQGIAQLRAAGIEVITGVCSDLIRQSLAPYLHQRKTGRPYCIAKGAVSIDGRIGAVDGTSQWISSPEARHEAHRLRAESQAILVGAGTACKDLPRLTIRDIAQPPIKPPLRVILDAQGKVLATGPLFDTKDAPTLIFTTQECPQQVKRSWEQCGVEVAVISKAKDGIGVNLEEVVDILGKRGILQVLIEGGGSIIGAFMDAQLLHSFNLNIGACILGNQGIPLVRTDAIGTLSQAVKLNLIDVKVFGDTVRLNYRFAYTK